MGRAVASILLLLALAAPGLAAGYIFRWVDSAGDLHITDRLADVPEPYHSMYVAQLKRIEEEKAKGKGTRKTSPTAPPASSSSGASESAEAGPSIVEQEIARQKYWRDLVALWRSELATATGELEAINEELARARLNPLLRTTPPVKAKIAEIEGRRALALEKVGAARTMLLKTIPERARKERVPPKWIL